MEGHDNTIGWTIALALGAGIGSQVLARALRLPSLVLMLATGVLLGPDGADLVRPSELATGLQVFVGVAVALILFEGGLALDFDRMRRAERPIRGLLSVGAAVTAVAAAALAHYVLGWDPRLAIPFGALVIVTGPTVIGPLLARLRPHRRVATVLETEGVLGDALGAIAAAVALEVALSSTGEAIALALPALAGRLVAGAALGLVGGALIALLRRSASSVPERLSNGLTVGLVVVLFHAANAALPESGVAAVVAAGFVVRRVGGRNALILAEFKEQVIPIFIGALFVLLAADVRLADVWALGWPGAIVCAALALLVRPLAVALSTYGSDLSVPERATLAAIAPRGIVAASVASLFAFKFGEHGVEGGNAFRALVFAVIASSVASAAVLGPMIISLTGIRRRESDGWLIHGATPLSAMVAQVLAQEDQSVVLLDPDPHRVRRMEALGHRCLQGDGLDPSALARAQLDSRRGTLALTQDPLRNYILALRSRHAAPELRHLVALDPREPNLSLAQAEEAGLEGAFTVSLGHERWNALIEEDRVRLACVRVARRVHLPIEIDAVLPVMVRTGRSVELLATGHVLRPGAVLTVLFDEQEPEALNELAALLGPVTKRQLAAGSPAPSAAPP